MTRGLGLAVSCALLLASCSYVAAPADSADLARASLAEEEEEGNCLAWWMERRFHELSLRERELMAMLLGPDAEAQWDNLDLPTTLPDWSSLSAAQRESLLLANFTADLWACIGRELAEAGATFPDKVDIEAIKVTVEAPYAKSIFRPPRLEQLTFGVYNTAFSALMASVAAHLVRGMWETPVRFKLIAGLQEACELLDRGEVDVVIGALQREDRRDAQFDGAVKDYGDLGDDTVEYLYTTVPQGVPDVRTDLSWFWTDLRRIHDILPNRTCNMYPGNGTGYGVWCLSPPPGNEPVQVIWTAGPWDPDRQNLLDVYGGAMELMAFLHAQGLTYGIHFMRSGALARKVYLAARSGRPALMLLAEPSNLVDVVEHFTQRVHLPVERQHLCGEVGTAQDVGNWTCTFKPRRLAKLGRASLHHAVSVFLSRFDLVDKDTNFLFKAFRKSLRERAISPTQHDVSDALGEASQEWIASHVRVWEQWFMAAQNVAMVESRKYVIAFILIGLLAYCVSEWQFLKIPRVPHQDKVDRSEPTRLALECVSGTMDTITVMLRSVGMASVLCASEEFELYQGVVLKHILLGHLCNQVVTLVCSNYETPLHTPSIEILPLLTGIRARLQIALVGQRSETVVVTMIFSSAFISITSGLLIYLIGHAKMGSALRFLPFAVEIGVQGALGVVLVDLGIAASCGIGFFDMIEKRDLIYVELWLPAILFALGIYFFTNFISESPYTIVAYMVFATTGFHCLRSFYGMFGDTLEAAQKLGWLYPSADYGSLWSFYTQDTNDIYWGFFSQNWDQVLVSVLIISIVNCMCQLAVTSSLLPPKIMGQSDFDHEMIVQGRGKIISGLLMGYSSDFGNDDTLVHRMFGGRYRLGIYVHVGTLSICLVWGAIGQNTLPYIPKFVNGTVVLIAALEILMTALVDGYRRLATSEYIVVLLVIGIAFLTFGQVILALIFGVLFGFVEFAIKYSMSMITPPVVVTDSPGVAYIELSGYLFFATAPKVVDAVLASMPVLSRNDKRALVVDFAAVPGLDTKAALEFGRLTTDLECGLIIFSGMLPNVERELKRVGVLAASKPPASQTNIELGKIRSTSAARETESRARGMEDMVLSRENTEFERVTFISQTSRVSRRSIVAFPDRVRTVQTLKQGLSLCRDPQTLAEIDAARSYSSLTESVAESASIASRLRSTLRSSVL